MPRTILYCCAFLVLVFLRPAASQANDFEPVRAPVGVYAKVDIETAISGFSSSSTLTEAQLRADLCRLYAQLLSDPAVTGITVGEHWDNIETAETDPDGYNWAYLDDAFEVANAFRKRVQLIITPGVDSPPWLFSQLKSCDGLFDGTHVDQDCGKVTFTGFPQQTQRADTNTFPLPWNTTYQNAWHDFIRQLDERYRYNSAFTAISVTGPVGASNEWILPNDLNTTNPQPHGDSPNEMWAALIANSFPATDNSYQHSDQVFIDAWQHAIEDAESVFSGVTLVVSPDSGSDLPNFSSNVIPHSDNILFTQDCAASISADPGTDLYKDLMPCEAKTEILSEFIRATGPNGKATRVGGMTASSPETLATGDIGVPGIKLLTSLLPPPTPRFQGGAELDHPVSSALQNEGCPNPQGGCTGLTIEEGMFNVLTVFFDQTPVAPFYDGTFGRATVQYLEVDYVDMQYAEGNPCPAATSPTLGKTSLQDLLNRANRDLLAMAGSLTPLAPPTCADHRMWPW